MIPKNYITFRHVVPVSATTGFGVDYLKSCIRELLDEDAAIAMKAIHQERLQALRYQSWYKWTEISVGPSNYNHGWVLFCLSDRSSTLWGWTWFTCARRNCSFSTDLCEKWQRTISGTGCHSQDIQYHETPQVETESVTGWEPVIKTRSPYSEMIRSKRPHKKLSETDVSPYTKVSSSSFRVRYIKWYRMYSATMKERSACK